MVLSKGAGTMVLSRGAGTLVLSKAAGTIWCCAGSLARVVGASLSNTLVWWDISHGVKIFARSSAIANSIRLSPSAH
eukprot:15483709-Alexandrium_andersonii.AAC.1